ESRLADRRPAMSRIKRIVILAVIAIGTYILMSSIYTVSEVEQAIITQFGMPIGAPVTDAGLKFKVPFIQDVNLIDKRVLEWTAIRPICQPRTSCTFRSTSSPAGGLSILSSTFFGCTTSAVLNPAWTIF